MRSANDFLKKALLWPSLKFELCYDLNKIGILAYLHLKCKPITIWKKFLTTIFATWEVQMIWTKLEFLMTCIEIITINDLINKTWRQSLQVEYALLHWWFDQNWNSWLLALKWSQLTIWSTKFGDNLCKLNIHYYIDDLIEQDWNSWRRAFKMQTYNDLTKSSWRQFLQLEKCKWI